MKFTHTKLARIVILSRWICGDLQVGRVCLQMSWLLFRIRWDVVILDESHLILYLFRAEFNWLSLLWVRFFFELIVLDIICLIEFSVWCGVIILFGCYFWIHGLFLLINDHDFFLFFILANSGTFGLIISPIFIWLYWLLIGHYRILLIDLPLILDLILLLH